MIQLLQRRTAHLQLEAVRRLAAGTGSPRVQAALRRYPGEDSEAQTPAVEADVRRFRHTRSAGHLPEPLL